MMFMEAFEMSLYHHVTEISIENGVLSMIIDGNPFKDKLCNISSILSEATDEQLRTIELSPSGYGLYWPLLDEDISIDGLLGISHEQVFPSQIA